MNILLQKPTRTGSRVFPIRYLKKRGEWTAGVLLLLPSSFFPARNMKADKVPIDQIAKVTGFSVDTVEAL
jgi:hypothetical protein